MITKFVFALAMVKLAACQRSLEEQWSYENKIPSFSGTPSIHCQLVAAGEDGSLWQSAESRLYNFLFGLYGGHQKYNPTARPRKNSNDVVNVSVGFSLLSINSLDDREQVLSTTGYFLLQWTDEYLTWDPRNFDNITSLVVQPQEIWLPADVGIENSVGTIYKETFRSHFRASVSYTGKVIWTPGGRIYTACSLDVTFYPFDIQNCRISMASWAYTAKHVYLTTELNGKIGLSDYHINGEWHIAETGVVSGVRYYGAPYSFVMFKVSIQRKYYYHLINLLLPCSLLSGLIALVFKLPAESDEKAGLAITILLAFSVFILMIAEMLPTTSESLPIIGFYLTFLLFASSMSLFVMVYTMGMYRATGEQMVPTIVRQILYSLAVITWTTRPTFSNLDELPSFIGNRYKNFPKKQRIGTKTGYLVKYLKPQRHILEQLSMQNKDSSVFEVFDDALFASHVSASLWQPEVDNDDGQDNSLRILRKGLAAFIEEVTWKLKVTEIQEIIKVDWQQCALCIDRICFRIFSLVIGLATFLMCIILPIIRKFSIENHW